jgi:hypothetical protein
VNWEGLIAYLGSTAVVVTALGFLARRTIDQWLEQRLESHKAALTHASQTALEQLKSDLRVEELRANRLVDQQATILADLYAMLERLHGAVVALSKPVLHVNGGALRLRADAVSEFEQFEAYYYPRAIWLERGTCDQLNALLDLMRLLLVQLSSNLTAEGEVADRPRWLATYDRINADVPAARKLIEEEFRSILGVAKRSE